MTPAAPSTHRAPRPKAIEPPDTKDFLRVGAPCVVWPSGRSISFVGSVTRLSGPQSEFSGLAQQAPESNCRNPWGPGSDAFHSNTYGFAGRYWFMTALSGFGGKAG